MSLYVQVKMIMIQTYERLDAPGRDLIIFRLK
jgi:hypothetical protein